MEDDEDNIDNNINEKWENIKRIIKATKQQVIEKDESKETLKNRCLMKRFKRCTSVISETLWSSFKIQGRNFIHELQNWLHISQLFESYSCVHDGVIQYQTSSVAFILFLPVAMCLCCCVPCCGIYWQSSVWCKHCAWKRMCGMWSWGSGRDWISSIKLLKLAQLYPVYCTMVLMAFIILENL